MKTFQEWAALESQPVRKDYRGETPESNLLEAMLVVEDKEEWNELYRLFNELAPSPSMQMKSAMGGGGTLRHITANIYKQKDARMDVVGYENAFKSMVSACAAILDPQGGQTVDLPNDDNTSKTLGTVPWSDLYSVATFKSTPEKGYITLYWTTQKDQGMLGGAFQTARYFGGGKTSKHGEKSGPLSRGWSFARQMMGLGTPHIEDYFKRMFYNDLISLQNAGDLEGVEQWTLKSQGMGRNLYVMPKPKYKELGMAIDSGSASPAGAGV